MLIEWTGQQQWLFLMKSIPVGMTIGVMFSVINGLERKRVFCFQQFAADVLFFIVSALITFFASLIIMDGHLHPILFGGIIMGFSFVNFICGRYISRLVCYVGNVFGFLTCFIKNIPKKWSARMKNTSEKATDHSDIA